MKIKGIVFIILSGAGLVACSSVLTISEKSEQVKTSSELPSDVEMDSLIAPYSRQLAKEMSVQLGEALVDMTVQRPNSNLGAWTCDHLLAFGVDSLKLSGGPILSVLNTGGLRSSLSKGPIVVGDMFKLMPFDNEVVAVKLPLSVLDELLAYLRFTGGEPIAGFKIVQGKLVLDDKRSSSYFWVISTDFLVNGGDKMVFFTKATERIDSKVLLRDLLINAVKKQKKIGNSMEERITW